MTSEPAFDSRHFRQVLGHFPTGVVVVAAIDDSGQPAGMTVGSFTSVSLDPPMVAFLPDKASTSFPRIASAPSFCVSVLSYDQEDICRAFAAKGGDKFASIRWSPGPSGAPVLDGAVAWIDCEIETVHEAGDHLIVVGRVLNLGVGGGSLAAPLLFHRGGYARVGANPLVGIP
jgi:flavin reductase (DIM6/NTAB) family NADH-FMN oxidoreductase RutF